MRTMQAVRNVIVITMLLILLPTSSFPFNSRKNRADGVWRVVVAHHPRLSVSISGALAIDGASLNYAPDCGECRMEASAIAGNEVYFEVSDGRTVYKFWGRYFETADSRGYFRGIVRWKDPSSMNARSKMASPDFKTEGEENATWTGAS